jgi:hypothetical protein
MTNYTITNDLFVVNSDNIVCGGPYKNEESAKRRVRNLRQKDADALANVAACDAPSMDFETSRVTDPRSGLMFDIPNYPLTARVPTANTIAPPALPDAAKLAASSAYGKTASNSPFGTMQAGVYPAISKSERRKRWNYA